VILDEPMSGLDPVGRRHMHDLILRLRDTGTTVIFSSHILPDAERLCTRVGILAHGRLREVIQVAHDGPPVGYLLTISDVAPQFLAAVTGDPNVTVLSTNGTCQLRLNDQHTVKAVLDSVTRAGGRVESLTPIHPSLEERFLAYVEQAKED